MLVNVVVSQPLSEALRINTEFSSEISRTHTQDPATTRSAIARRRRWAINRRHLTSARVWNTVAMDLISRIWSRYRKLEVKWQIGIGVLVFLVLVGLFIDEEPAQESSSSPTTTPNRRTVTTEKEVTTTSSMAAPTTAPTTAAPTTTTSRPDPGKALQASLLKALGRSNREGVTRVLVHSANPGLEIVLTWAINENLSEGMTKDGSRLETKKMLEWIKDNYTGDYTAVRMEGTYSLQDEYGNASEDRVFLGTYSRETVRKINYDSVNFKRLWDLTDGSTFVHPAFQY